MGKSKKKIYPNDRGPKYRKLRYLSIKKQFLLSYELNPNEETQEKLTQNERGIKDRIFKLNL